MTTHTWKRTDKSELHAKGSALAAMLRPVTADAEIVPEKKEQPFPISVPATSWRSRLAEPGRTTAKGIIQTGVRVAEHVDRTGIKPYELDALMGWGESRASWLIKIGRNADFLMEHLSTMPTSEVGILSKLKKLQLVEAAGTPAGAAKAAEKREVRNIRHVSTTKDGFIVYRRNYPAYVSAYVNRKSLRVVIGSTDDFSYSEVREQVKLCNEEFDRIKASVPKKVSTKKAESVDIEAMVQAEVKKQLAAIFKQLGNL